MRDFIVLLVYLLLLPRVFGGSVFVSGTYAGDIRYDVKKVAYGAEGSPDHLMCWAASASNNIQLWQDNLASSGYAIPSGIPNGKTQSTYSSDIFYIFANSWTDVAGCSTFAYQWFLTGDYDAGYAGGFEASKPRADAVSDGGYWSFLNLDMDNLVERIMCQDGSALHPVEGSRDLFVRAIDTVFENGWYASLSVNNWGNHSVTLAGYETDDFTGEITGLWLCDSDNPNAKGNYLIDVAWDDGWQAWMLGSAHMDESGIVSDYGNLEGWMIVSMDVFKAPVLVPEPSSYVAICGVFALGFALFRRRGMRKASYAVSFMVKIWPEC